MVSSNLDDETTHLLGAQISDSSQNLTSEIGMLYLRIWAGRTNGAISKRSRKRSSGAGSGHTTLQEADDANYRLFHADSVHPGRHTPYDMHGCFC